jgi:hypothetical protein
VRVLLDENVPHDLIPQLAGHDIATVQGLGLAGIKNGDLLERARGGVDVFVTMDRKLEKQHDVSGLPFGIVVIVAKSNRMVDLLPLVNALGQPWPGSAPAGSSMSAIASMQAESPLAQAWNGFCSP